MNSVKDDDQFKNELENLICFFESSNEKSKLKEGMKSIYERLIEIKGIVFNKKILYYKQEGYSYLRPFEDCYQDAIDFFQTSEGKRTIDLLNYFGYNYKISAEQLGGYNKSDLL